MTNEFPKPIAELYAQIQAMDPVERTLAVITAQIGQATCSVCGCRIVRTQRSNGTWWWLVIPSEAAQRVRAAGITELEQLAEFWDDHKLEEQFCLCTGGQPHYPEGGGE